MANAQMGKCANTSCFAHSSGRCLALSNVKCKYACPFYKTQEQISLEREKSKARLLSIGKYDKYKKKYGGVVSG